MPEQEALLKLARTRMPFGRYEGTLLIDLPGPYLVWFDKNGYPKGELGELLALAHEIDMNGLKSLITPLKQ